MNECNYDLFYEFEKSIVKIINKFISKNRNLLNLKFKGYDLEKTCEKLLYNELAASDAFYNFFCDINKNTIKKSYIFDSYHVKLMAVELAKIYEVKINKKNLLYKKKFFNKTFFIFGYLFFIVFSYFFTFQIKKKKSIICILNNQKFKTKYKFILRKFNQKIFYANFKNFISFNNIKNLKFNFQIYFKDILKQKSFFFMHKIYLKTYILDVSISMNSPLLIMFYEGDAYDHEIAAQIGKKNNIKSVCIQWGSILYKKPKSSFRNSGYMDFLAWGKESKEMFLKYNPEISVKIIGAPNLKFYNYNKSKILFLLPQKSSQFNLEEVEKFNQLLMWAINKFQKKLIIRTHPQDKNVESIKKIINQNQDLIEDPKKISLGESLSKSFMMITMGSSAIFEAAHQGVIPLLYAKSKRNIWNKNIQNLKFKYSCKLFENQNILKLKHTIISIEKNRFLRKKIANKIINEFKSEISYSGSRSKILLNNYIDQIIQ
mgnify:CR=1 FL=1|tara:strand:- start:2221 stop:3681 length:1461 start_codon:yes stop_codon:yes gene_type:complete